MRSVRRTMCGLRASACGSVLLFVALWATNARAGVPLPGNVYYGAVRIDAVTMTAKDNVHVIARVDNGGSLSDPVGSYKLGDSAVVGNRYRLQIRVESLADGIAPSATAARLDDTVKFFLRQANGPEQEVQSVLISEVGAVSQLDLCINPSGASEAAVPGNCANDFDDDCDGLTDVNDPDCPLAGNCVAGAILDLADHALFGPCVSGPGSPIAGGCGCADVDADNDVDLRDWKFFQDGFTGSAR